MSITIENATKIYGNSAVVNRVSLEVDDAEFLVLIGPSGSGKSTLLRMIAGLTDLNAGRVILHGRDVTQLPPQQRGVGFVFQNYALFRHMSAAENIAYGLRVRKVAAAARQDRVEELLDLVGLTGLGHRLPSQLSGGQQQRVALARALAFKPDVLLLDEPFGALDAKIRTDLRRSIKRIQREVGVPTIFVTHDQEEAFALADRVGVMHDGELIEIGSSSDLYERPKADFTATFLGSANLLLGIAAGSRLQLGEARFDGVLGDDDSAAQRLAKVLVRPEDVSVSSIPFQQDSRFVTEATVEDMVFCGPTERVRLAFQAGPGLQVLHPQPPFGSPSMQIEALRSRSETTAERLRPGDRVYIGFRRVHCLEILRSMPLLGGSNALQFLKAAGAQQAPNPDAVPEQRGHHHPATPPSKGADAMEIDTDKVLVWFGEPRPIERILINLSGDDAQDRELIFFARQAFSSGRPPSIELLHVQPAGRRGGDGYLHFLSAAKRELQLLATPVRITQRIGNPENELRTVLSQSDCTLLISHLFEDAAIAQASGELSQWVTQRFGPVSTMFFRLQPTATERAA